MIAIYILAGIFIVSVILFFVLAHFAKPFREKNDDIYQWESDQRDDDTDWSELYKQVTNEKPMNE